MEEAHDLIYARAVRHGAGHAVWFQLMGQGERERWAAERRISLEEAVEAWAKGFEATAAREDGGRAFQPAEERCRGRSAGVIAGPWKRG